MSVSRDELFQFNYHQASNKVSDTKALFQITTFLLHILSEGQRRSVCAQNYFLSEIYYKQWGNYMGNFASRHKYCTSGKKHIPYLPRPCIKQWSQYTVSKHLNWPGFRNQRWNHNPNSQFSWSYKHPLGLWLLWHPQGQVQCSWTKNSCPPQHSPQRLK